MKIAIIDLYDKEPNIGIPAICEIVQEHGTHQIQVFEIRQQGDWPKMKDWDVFISSGGPGDPAKKFSWSSKWKGFMQSILDYNQTAETPKPVFMICFSFQLFCHHFELGLASKRDQPSYGSFSCRLTPYGKKDAIMGALSDNFQIADFRSYQITKPHSKNLKKLNAKILAIEKQRPHIDKAQALMAIQFSSCIYGTQFHPEANGDKVKETFELEKEKLQNFLGNKQYEKAVKKLDNIEGINQTQTIILPRFLDFARSIISRDDSKI